MLTFPGGGVGGGAAATAQLRADQIGCLKELICALRSPTLPLEPAGSPPASAISLVPKGAQITCQTSSWQIDSPHAPGRGSPKPVCSKQSMEWNL